MQVTCNTYPDNPFPVYNECRLSSFRQSRLTSSLRRRCWRFGEQVHQTRQLFDPRRVANDCGRIFSKPGYQQKYLPFPGIAHNKRHARRVPSDVGNGQFEFGGDTIRRSGDIRARAEASAIGGVVGEVRRKTTTVSLSTRMDVACASQIQPRSESPILRNAGTDGHRQTSLLYIYRCDAHISR